MAGVVVNIKVCSPLKLRSGLTGKYHAICHYSYNLPLKAPTFNNARSERVYELRSYESATEQYNINKVEMFNVGGEIDLFEQLGFNAVFYGEVISGAKLLLPCCHCPERHAT